MHEKFCESLEEHPIKITNCKKMKLLIKEQQESYENATLCYICEEKSENKYLKDKKYRKVREIIVIMLRNIEVQLIAYVISNIVYLKNFL